MVAVTTPWSQTKNQAYFSTQVPGQLSQMANTVASGPQNAFSADLAAKMRQRSLSALQGTQQAANKGIAQANAARGVAGPNAGAIMGAQNAAANRGALANMALDTELAGRNLGLQEYQANLAGMSEFGSQANNQAARELEMIQMGLDPTTGQRYEGAGTYQQMIEMLQAGLDPATGEFSATPKTWQQYNQQAMLEMQREIQELINSGRLEQITAEGGQERLSLADQAKYALQQIIEQGGQQRLGIETEGTQSRLLQDLINSGQISLQDLVNSGQINLEGVRGANANSLQLLANTGALDVEKRRGMDAYSLQGLINSGQISLQDLVNSGQISLETLRGTNAGTLQELINSGQLSLQDLVNSGQISQETLRGTNANALQGLINSGQISQETLRGTNAATLQELINSGNLSVADREGALAQLLEQLRGNNQAGLQSLQNQGNIAVANVGRMAQGEQQLNDMKNELNQMPPQSMYSVRQVNPTELGQSVTYSVSFTPAYRAMVDQYNREADRYGLPRLNINTNATFNNYTMSQVRNLLGTNSPYIVA